MRANDNFDITCCATDKFAFEIQTQSISVDHFMRENLFIDYTGTQVSLLQRKGN